MRPTRTRGDWTQIPDAERHGQHRRHAAVRCRHEAAVHRARTMCSSSAPSTRSGRRARSWRRRTSRCASLGDVDRNRRADLLGEGHVAGRPQHRFDASFFGDPSKGDNGPQRRRRCLRIDNVGIQRARPYGGHNQTLRYDGVLSQQLPGEASFARALNRISEIPSVDDLG